MYDIILVLRQKLYQPPMVDRFLRFRPVVAGRFSFIKILAY
nr:MAG TPA: hypothetical protein [Caudoviricetes sp.]